MSKEFTTEELKGIASQLSCPEGYDGIKMAERMAIGNSGMTRSSITYLSIKDEDHVLEIGPGNASHLQGLLDLAMNLKYTGTDISSTMITEASRINHTAIEAGKAEFVCSDGKNIPFPAASFHKIFTVNTLYFWTDPLEYAREIARILKPGGKFCVTFADGQFMEKLPFTSYGFKLYGMEDAEALLKNAGFLIENIIEEEEKVLTHTGESLNRLYFTIVATI